MAFMSAKRDAFTLAEVLITLGVIGVVAAMTLPILIQNYKKKEYATRVHKAYADLLQAIQLSEAENGPFEEWKCDGTGSQITIDFVETYIKPYYAELKFCSEGTSNKACGLTVSYSGANYITNSGVGLSMRCIPPSSLYVIIDVNNSGNPNTLGTDAFYFNTLNDKKLLLPYAFDAHPTREQILQGFIAGSYYVSCKKTKTEDSQPNRDGCTLLLYLDNWEFKDDYPWE